ncbi:MAG: CHAT domain-containing protein [Cyanobacteria bacterium P01_F01_bin.150]
MVLGQQIGQALAMLLLAVGSAGTIVTREIMSPSLVLAQVMAESQTGRLNTSRQRLYDGSYFSRYTFGGNEGEQITIAVDSQDFDAYVMLLDPDGAFIAHSDNTEGLRMFQPPNGNPMPQADPSGDSTDAFLIITLPSTGTYQILVNTRNAGQTGQYTVSWRQSTAADLAKKPPNVIPSGEFDAGFEAEDLEIQLSNLINARQYEDAIALAEARLEISREYDGKYSYGILFQLNRLALLHIELQRFEPAEALYTQALALAENQPQFATMPATQGSNQVVTILDGLASLYQSQGRYDQAAALFDRSEAISQQRSADNLDFNPYANFSQQQAESDLDLVGLYRAQGRYKEAETILIEALDRSFDHVGFVDNLSFSQVLARFDIDFLEMLQSMQASDASAASIVGQLAMLDYLQGRDEHSEALFKEAIAIFDRVMSRTSTDIFALAMTNSDFSLLYSGQSRYTEAEPLLIQSLQVLQELEFGYYSDDVVTALQGVDWNTRPFSFTQNMVVVFDRLAELYYHQGRYGKAESMYRKILEFYQSQLSDRHPSVASSFNNLAVLYQAQDNIDAAVQHLQQGLDIEEWNLDLNLATLAETQRQAYATTVSDTTNRSISFAFQDGVVAQLRQSIALETILRRKGRLLDAGTTSVQRLRQNLTLEDQTLLDNLTTVRQTLATLTFNPPENQPPGQYRIQLQELEQQANDLESELTRRSAAFRVESQAVDIETIQTQIPTNGVLIEYIRYRPFNAKADRVNEWGSDRYAVYLLFPNGRIEAIDLGDAAAINTAIQSFTDLLQDRRATFRSASIDLRIRDDIVDSTTDTLKTLLIDPIAPHLTDIDHLLISPDSQLNRLPFEALQVEPSGDYLIQRYQISYLNSGRDLLKFNITEPSTNPAVILANPNYDTADASVDITAAASPPAPESPQITRATNRRSTDLSTLQVTPLPGTQAEVNAIQPLFPNATILTGPQATENTLKTVQSPHILHLATHGFFLPNLDRPDPNPPTPQLPNSPTPQLLNSSTPQPPLTENPLLRSGLIFAGFNPRRSGSEDGALTALEASNLKLSGTQLVVLSACDTGLGDIANGEGVYGLRRAFAIAGAESQLISLWQVSDDGTQSLMARYYENLTKGMGRSNALRAVQLEMINAGDEYSHPYYWAPFILTGDWRPIESPGL